MRVVLFTECYRPIQNGVVAAVDALRDALHAQGHDVFCVTPAMPGYRETNGSIVRIPSLPLPLPTPTAYRLTIPFLPRRVVAPMLRRPSVVHAHSPFITGWLGLRTARRYRAPLVFTYHTKLEDYAHYVPFETRITRSAALGLTRMYANAADAVIVPTAAMETHLRAMGVKSRIDVVPSGIDVELFASGSRSDDVRARFGVAPHDSLVLSVGRLGREKNVELSIETLREMPDSVRLVIVGDGPHAKALRTFATRTGVADRVHFANELPRTRLPDVYASADAFLFTSSSETQGLVLAEALAARLPVVAVDTPATRDVLRNFGFIATRDPASLAAALRTALAGATPSDGAGAMRFDRRRFGEGVVAVYEALLRSRGAA